MIMGKVIIAGGGGSGAGSDECTASKSEVLKGYKAITSDSDDEVVEGTLELTGDVSDSQVLEGKTYYNSNPKIKRTGSMVNHGAVSLSLNAGASYTVPAGFHNGGGKVTANSLASQTSATATAAQIISGQTAWVNGSKLTGTLSVNSILSFSVAVYSSTAIVFTWQNPVKGPFSGVIIVGKTGSHPMSITDGTRYYKGSGNNSVASGTSSTAVTSFAGGTTYYFRAFSYAVKDGAEWVSATTYTATAATTKGQQSFTSSGAFTIPAGVRSIDVFCVGGGGGGAGGDKGGTKYAAGGGGGGGYTATQKAIPVTPGQQISIVVGSGGSGGASMTSGTDGGTSYVTISGTNYCTANGGKKAAITPGGAGGSGGGGAGSTAGYNGGNGGSDGSYGATGDPYGYGGSGQKTTTRAYGESSNTLYAGGGGGGGNGQYTNTNRGYGGAGGGGNGSDAMGNLGSNGTAGTGGGGGGGYQYGSAGGSGFAGGSGICLIRWGY